MSKIAFDHKILPLSEVTEKVREWRSENARIVFTNGCFDLLHKGHVEYLRKASEFGDRLLVGLNSDRSVEELDKGPERPLMKEMDRAFLLAALLMVDAVTIFPQSTPLDLIGKVQPDVLVKGGDWDPTRIVGHDIVKQKGGEVHALPFFQGYSTTGLIERIRGEKGG